MKNTAKVYVALSAVFLLLFANGFTKRQTTSSAPAYSKALRPKGSYALPKIRAKATKPKQTNTPAPSLNKQVNPSRQKAALLPPPTTPPLGFIKLNKAPNTQEKGLNYKAAQANTAAARPNTANIQLLTQATNTGLAAARPNTANIQFLTQATNTGLTAARPNAANRQFLTQATNTGLAAARPNTANRQFLNQATNAGLAAARPNAANRQFLNQATNSGLAAAEPAGAAEAGFLPLKQSKNDFLPQQGGSKDQQEVIEDFDAGAFYVTTAADPRFGEQTNPHRAAFVPASEVRPPEAVLSIPIKDEREPFKYDINEREENRVFSSDFYIDAGVYYSGVDGDERLSSKKEGSFYETNYRYELFSTQNNGDSMAFTIDTTYSNDKKAYNHTFTLNQASLETKTQRSRLVLGHSFPEMSEFTMTQNILGIYGAKKFDSTTVSAFAGYYAAEREDLHNPRYVSGFRAEHDRDGSMRLGINFVGLEDDFSNSAANTELCEMSNRMITFDAHLKPTENLELSAEAGKSTTDFDKGSNEGEETGDGYRIKSSYENNKYKIEVGTEQGSSGFTSFMGAPPRDEQAYFARFYYELNKNFSTSLSRRDAKDNMANYAKTSVNREQTELQFTIRPSEYYKDLRIDLFYQPLKEYSEISGFMNRGRSSLWAEFNQKAGSFLYYLGLSKTTDRDKITPLNNNDTKRFDFNLTYEYDKLNSLYTSYSLENIDYFNAKSTNKTSWLGLGLASRFGKNVLLNVDYLKERFEPNTFASNHDRANVSLTREYSLSSRLILSLEGNKNSFDGGLEDSTDYTAKLRYLKAF